MSTHGFVSRIRHIQIGLGHLPLTFWRFYMASQWTILTINILLHQTNLTKFTAFYENCFVLLSFLFGLFNYLLKLQSHYRTDKAMKIDFAALCVVACEMIHIYINTYNIYMGLFIYLRCTHIHFACTRRDTSKHFHYLFASSLPTGNSSDIDNPCFVLKWQKLGKSY